MLSLTLVSLLSLFVVLSSSARPLAKDVIIALLIGVWGGGGLVVLVEVGVVVFVASVGTDVPLGLFASAPTSTIAYRKIANISSFTK